MDFDRLLNQLSKGTLAVLIIGGGILFVILSDPPRDVCDAQVRLFKEEQTGFLYLDQKKRMIKTTGFEEREELCRQTQSPGGCYELFMNMKVLLDDLQSVNNQCVTEVVRLKKVREAITRVLDLLIQLAWLDNRQNQFLKQWGWLDVADINLFCRLKNTYQIHYGRTAWEQFQEQYFSALPGVDELKSRAKIWQNLILSVNCDQFI